MGFTQKKKKKKKTTLSTVVDTTQTAFHSDHWIGDNVLAHLEEVEYLENMQEPGCLVFLEFFKAYDRLNRHWVDRCWQHLGVVMQNAAG